MELQNLNKENFFDALQERYPHSTEEFFGWIDDYKKQNNWNYLFGEKIKYHHLPIAMQIGIWIDFLFYVHGENESITITEDYKYNECVYEWFSEFFNNREMYFNSLIKSSGSL